MDKLQTSFLKRQSGVNLNVCEEENKQEKSGYTRIQLKMTANKITKNVIEKFLLKLKPERIRVY